MLRGSRSSPEPTTQLLIQSPRRRGREGSEEFEAKRFRGLEVDDQLELCRLLDGQIGRFRALENPTRVIAAQAIVFSNPTSVAHQTAGYDKFAKLENRRNRVTRRQSDKLIASAEENWVVSEK